MAGRTERRGGLRGARAGALVGGGLVVSVVLAGCGSAGWGSAGGGGGADTINVLMVNNSQMVDLQKLTTDNFTAKTGIRVNFTVLPENDVRDKISQEFSSQAGQYDVATVSNFEIPIYARSKWIAPLSDYIAKDTAFDQDDILKPMTESLSKDGASTASRSTASRRSSCTARTSWTRRASPCPRTRRGTRSPRSRPRSTVPSRT